MSDSISATCVCGAEFGANSKKAITFWREWKENHSCELAKDQHTALGIDTDTPEDNTTEFQIGFQYEPDE